MKPISGIFLFLILSLWGCSHGSYYQNSALTNHHTLLTNTASKTSSSPPLLNHEYLKTKAQYRFLQGQHWKNANEPEKAIKSFQLALIFDPKSSLIKRELAGELLKANKIDHAIVAAKEALRTDPKSIQTLSLLGGMYGLKGQFKTAHKYYRKALKIEPRNSQTHLYVAAIYAEQNRYKWAYKHAHKALKYTKEETLQSQAYSLMGRMNLNRGPRFISSAVKYLKKSLTVQPHHIENTLLLASAYEQFSQSQKAAELLEKFQKDYGFYMPANQWLVQYYVDRRQFKKAKTKLLSMEKTQPDDPLLKIRIALFFVERKWYDEAIAKLQIALKMVPSMHKITLYLGLVYAETNQYDKAIEAYTRVPAKSLHFSEAITQAAYLLQNEQKTEEALEVVSEALEKNQTSPKLYILNALLLDETKDYAESLDIMEVAAKKFPKHDGVQFFAGWSAHQIYNKELALNYMKKAIALNPAHAQALNYLAYTYADINRDLNQAYAWAQRAEKLEPKNPFVIDTLGWVLFKKKQTKRSLAYFKRALRIKPDESKILEHLGDVYYKLKRFKQSETHYLKSLASIETSKEAQRLKTKIMNLTHLPSSDKIISLLKFSKTRTPSSTLPPVKEVRSFRTQTQHEPLK